MFYSHSCFVYFISFVFSLHLNVFLFAKTRGMAHVRSSLFLLKVEGKDLSAQRNSRTVSHPKCSTPRHVTCGAVYILRGLFSTSWRMSVKYSIINFFQNAFFKFRENTSWKVRVYGIYARVVDLSEIERVRF